MNIKTWIKFEESFLPPRCRKLRYRECEDYINVSLKEIGKSELKLAFEDNSYSGKGKIYLYNGKLYCKEKMPNSNFVEDLRERGVKIDSPLDFLIWRNEHCSSYFLSAYDREHYKTDTSKKAAMKAAKNDMKKYILADGELLVQCPEPRYVINTFGLGHNHGGTGMFCGYHYNQNIPKERYFSALEGEKAVAYANKVAAARGDTNDVGKFKPFIICHMPELVKVKPNKQHGNGNNLLNSFEDIVEGSDSAIEAGLLIMVTCAK